MNPSMRESGKWALIGPAALSWCAEIRLSLHVFLWCAVLQTGFRERCITVAPHHIVFRGAGTCLMACDMTCRSAVHRWSLPGCLTGDSPADA